MQKKLETLLVIEFPGPPDGGSTGPGPPDEATEDVDEGEEDDIYVNTSTLLSLHTQHVINV